MKKPFLFKIIILLMFQCYFYDASAQMTTDQLLENTYYLYDAQRQYNGVYRDSKIINGTDYHPSSVANTGVGLISLCIADRAGYITYSKDLAVQTLRTILGYNAGFNPDRNSKGFYRHFIDIDTGNNAWNSEYSTIDTALLAAGALFAKKYFNDAEVSAYADELFLSIDWAAAISNPNTGAIWRELDGNGNGQGTSALPFNEYMIVAYLAMKSEGNSGGVATTAWNVWQQLNNFANANYWGYQLLADFDDINAFQSDFTVQFPYYLISWAHNSTLYRSYMANMAAADKLYYEKIAPAYPNLNAYEWGLGAGNSPTIFNGTNYTAFGYNADHINNHPARVVSPHIVAGYIPIRASAKNDLQQMLAGNKGIYTLDSGNQLLWRYSLDEVNWNSDQIQGIDYSTMLYGLAADKFGTSFFTTNNNYDFPVGTVIHDAYFETGWDGWSDGGADCARVLDTARSYENSYSIRIRDNSGTASSMTSPSLNLSSYNEVDFNFHFFANSMEVGEDFWLQYNDGSGFVTVATWASGTDFTNNAFGNFSVKLNTSGFNLVPNAKFRLRCDASGDADHIYIDQIVITGTGNGSFSREGNDATNVGFISNDSEITKNELTIYPNPVEDVLQLKTSKGSEITYRIINSLGQTVHTGKTSKVINVDNLQPGMYFIEVMEDHYKMMKRFIKK